MNITGISFKGTYPIFCKDMKQAVKIAGEIQGISKNLEAVVSQADGSKVFVTDFGNHNSAKIIKCLEKNTDRQHALTTNAALEAYRKYSNTQIPRQVDTYR